MSAAGSSSGERLERLGRAARRGDRTAFERLVVETVPQVHALALRLVGDDHEAWDVVQETYLRAYRSIGRFRSEAAVTTWLHRIAANCAATQLSRRRAVLPLDEALALADDDPGVDPVAAADGADDRLRLEGALRQLPEGLRAVVVLHDVYDLGHEAIAAELGISRAASKVRLHRARRRLRELLFSDRPRSLARGPEVAETPGELVELRRASVGSTPAAGGSADGPATADDLATRRGRPRLKGRRRVAAC